MDPGVGDFRELVGESGLDPSTDADLEELLGLIISQQVGDVGFACGSASAALAAVLGGQAALPVSGLCEDAQMAIHSAANACVCGGHLAMMDVGGLVDKGGLVEAAAAIAELLVAEHCRCPDSHGYLQEALEELQYVLAEQQLVARSPVASDLGLEWQSEGLPVAAPVAGSAAVCESVGTPSATDSRQQALAGSRQQALAGSRQQVTADSRQQKSGSSRQQALVGSRQHRHQQCVQGILSPRGKVFPLRLCLWQL